MHSLHGVDFYNVIPNASNGQELIAFFVDAIDHERACGTQILLEGDTVVMDNCGFHHGRLTEPLLRELLSDKGIQLIYQPPYSPEFNTCELCFNQIRKWLQSHSRYTEEETVLACIDAINSITMANSVDYFKRCGYLLD